MALILYNPITKENESGGDKMEYKIGMLDCNASKNSEAFTVITEEYSYMIDTGYCGAFSSLLKLHVATCKSPKTLDFLIISHGHDDHCKGIEKIVNSLSPSFIIFSPIHIYKHLLLDKFRSLGMDKWENSYNIVNKIKSSGKYMRFFRLISQEKLNLLQGEGSNFELSNEFNLFDFTVDTIILDKLENPYLDIIIAVNESDIKDTNDTLLRDKIENMITSNINEFETYDTGQTVIIEKALIELLKDIKLGTIVTELTNKDEFISIIKLLHDSELIEYDIIPSTINKNNFIKIFKSYVLNKINNSMSLIVRINDTLFTGDASKKQLTEILDFMSVRDKSIAIIKVAHHGSQLNHLPKLYNTMKPTLCLLKESTLTKSLIVSEYLENETDAKVIKASCFAGCTNGIVLTINQRNSTNNKYIILEYPETEAKKAKAKLLSANTIEFEVI